tara:strand:+ start:1120 stop:1389 length:270 start_codon:yes stop_codon:yes gene_type:complete
MSQFSTKNKSCEWFFLGHVLTANDPKLLELLKKYKVKADFRAYRGRSAVFVNNAYRISSIRKRLWGHPWAIHSDWLAEDAQHRQEKNND